MIAEQQRHGNIQSNMTGDRIAMGIDMGAMAHIMNILTDLYSNPVLAVIREYSTNALDANIEAGNTDPVQVTLPSALAPFIRFKDTGCGLTAEDIRGIYSQYGASTKRSTNDQVGMLGLGCKSALTYTSQFTLVSVKNGIRTEVIVSRDEEGAGGMTVVDERCVTDPNSTEVLVPVKRDDLNRFRDTCETFFAWWTPGTVLVNGEQPKRFEGLKLTDTLYVIQGDTPQVIMGNVAYPVERHRVDHGMRHGYTVAKFVNIGDVVFTPSREALRYDSATTVETVGRIGKEVAQHIDGAIQREIDGCGDDRAAAVAMMLKWRGIRGHYRGTVDYRFKGGTIPQNFICPGPQVKDQYDRPQAPQFTTVSMNGHYGRGLSYQEHTVRIESLPNTLFVYGYKLAKFTGNHKRKLAQYISERSIPNVAMVALSDAKVVSEWVDSARVVNWDDINAIKLPKNTPAPGAYNYRIPASYDIFEDGEHKSGVPSDDFDDTKKLLFWRGNRWGCESFIRALQTHCPSHIVVLLAENRVEKFQRNYPDAVHVRDFLNEKGKAWVDGLSDEVKSALAMRNEPGAADVLSHLQGREGEILDPALRTAIRSLSVSVKDETAQKRALENSGIMVNLPEWENPLDKYPLIPERSYYISGNVDHIILYANAVHSSRR